MGTSSWLVTNLSDQLKDVKDDHYVVQLRVFGGDDHSSESSDRKSESAAPRPALRASLQWSKNAPQIAHMLQDPAHYVNGILCDPDASFGPSKVVDTRQAMHSVRTVPSGKC